MIQGLPFGQAYRCGSLDKVGTCPPQAGSRIPGDRQERIQNRSTHGRRDPYPDNRDEEDEEGNIGDHLDYGEHGYAGYADIHRRKEHDPEGDPCNHGDEKGNRKHFQVLHGPEAEVVGLPDPPTIASVSTSPSGYNRRLTISSMTTRPIARPRSETKAIEAPCPFMADNTSEAVADESKTGIFVHVPRAGYRSLRCQEVLRKDNPFRQLPPRPARRYSARDAIIAFGHPRHGDSRQGYGKDRPGSSAT